MRGGPIRWGHGGLAVLPVAGPPRPSAPPWRAPCPAVPPTRSRPALPGDWRVIEARALGIPAVLSGHTHGGQIVLPVVGALAARKFPVAAGRLSTKGTELYVSAGVGTVILPVRINCPPEVALVTLRRMPDLES